MSDGDSNEAQIVMADAQFGVVQVMRPQNGFEAIYEGQSVDNPVYLFPEGRNIDQLAADGVAGYDPELARGLKIPLGARVLLWLPNLFFTDFSDPPNTLGYEWTFIWRLRTITDLIQGRIPYHFARDRGVPDTTQPAGQQARVPLPAAYNTITFIQTEPTSNPGRSINNIHSEDLEASSLTLPNPLLASGNRQPIQQGIVDPSVFPADAEQPGFLVHEMQAVGDELLIGVRRNGSSFPNWAFGTTDLRFVRMLGSSTPNVGVYVMTGTAP